MNLLLHHFRKDLRSVGWQAVLFWTLCLGGTLWFSTLPLEGRVENVSRFSSLMRCYLWFGCFVFAGVTVQRDAPLREGAFLRTRPAALPTLILSKFLTALVIIVPVALIQTFSLVLQGLKPGALDLLLVFTEELLVLSALGAVSMVLALQQESVGKYFTSALGLFFALFIGWIAFTWFKSWYFHHEKPDWSYDLEYLKLSRSLTAQFVTLAGSIIGIRLFVRSRRRETITKSLALTAVCTIAALFCWPVNFVKAFAPAPREAPKSEWPDQTKLKFAFEKDRNWKSIITFHGDSGYNGVRYRPVYGNARLTGLTGGWQPSYDNSYQSVLTLSNGKTFPINHKAWSNLGWQSLLPRLGIPCPAYDDPTKQVNRFELSAFKLEDATGAMTGAKLKGTLQIHFKRPVVLAKLPFRKGASTRIDKRLIEISRIERSGDQINYAVTTQSALIQLRGGEFANERSRFEFLVVNAGRGEFLFKGNQSGEGGQAGLYSLSTLIFSESIWRPDYSTKPVPPDWTDGAELLIIDDESGGSISQDFDFPSINLSNDR